MKEISQLLIAYDGSPCADAALDDLQRAGLPPTLEAVVVTVAYVFLPPTEGEMLPDELVPPGSLQWCSLTNYTWRRSSRKHWSWRGKVRVASRQIFLNGR